MYVLARHEGESIVMADGLIEVKVLSITGKIARLGVCAPREIDVLRKEQAAGAEAEKTKETPE